MGIYMKIGWKPLEVHNISNIYNNICSNNNSNIGRSIGYWTINVESGNKAFFCKVQAIKTTSTN
jgi:hypothetical protein